MPEALAPLVILVTFSVALALTIMCMALTKAFFGLVTGGLSWLPLIGPKINGTAHQVEQRITNVLGEVALKLEAGIGATWHMSARLIDWIGREINRHAGLLGLIATLLTPVGTIKNLIAGVLDARKLLARLHSLIVGIGHDLGTRTRTIERGIGEDVLPRIRGLEREVHGEIVRERLRARAAERTAEREITHLWKWTRHHALAAGTLAFAGAVALALARLGLGWLRCPSLGRLGKKVGCGGFAALDELLFGAITALAVTDICDFASAAYTVAEELSPLFIELVDVENALVGCHGATMPPPLRIGALSLPPAANPLPLAA